MQTQRYPQSVRYVQLALTALLSGLFACQLTLADSSADNAAPIVFDNSFGVRHSPVPGGVAVINLNSSPASTANRPEVMWENKNIAVLARDDRWFAVIGLPLDTGPGTHWLSVSGSDSTTLKISFQVEAHEYPLQKLVIADETRVTPPPSLTARLQVERKRMLDARNGWRADFDAGNFRLPVDGRISSIFGLQRLFNNTRRSRHLGLDIAVPTGVPVFASHAGIVAEVGDFHFNGKSVFIDHGRGMISLYSHLSQTRVQPGEYVIAGQTVGLVGATGRVTGPHLHWGIAFNGTWVDPQLFIVD